MRAHMGVVTQQQLMHQRLLTDIDSVWAETDDNNHVYVVL
jgi:hypothetical protein